MKKGAISLIFLLITISAMHAEIVYGVSNLFSLGQGSTQVEQATQVTNSELPSVTLTPNPFNPVVSIKVKSNHSASISIFSASGKLVKQTVVQPNVTNIWDASSHPSGLYIVRINTAKNVITRKITLMK
jgi:hypothetical protein